MSISPQPDTTDSRRYEAADQQSRHHSKSRIVKVLEDWLDAGGGDPQPSDRASVAYPDQSRLFALSGKSWYLCHGNDNPCPGRVP